MSVMKVLKLAGVALALATGGAALAEPSRANPGCSQRVVLFEMMGCPYCAATRAFLDANKVPFERIEIWRNPEAQAFMTREFGSTGVPVVVNGMKAVRGHTEEGLRKLLCLG